MRVSWAIVIGVLCGCVVVNSEKITGYGGRVTEVLAPDVKDPTLTMHGSGFYITVLKQRYEVTAAHVVKGSRKWQTHPTYDLAWRAVKPGASFDYAQSVNYTGKGTVHGIINGKWVKYTGKVIGYEVWAKSGTLITTTGTAESGSSGGALLNDRGKVIGVHIESAVEIKEKYAVPIEVLLLILTAKG
jgi:S1-C subfamily serine protease